MAWIHIFDFVRHIFEVVFYLITGPLLAIFAVKNIKFLRQRETQLLELQRKLLELETSNKQHLLDEKKSTKNLPDRDD